MMTNWRVGQGLAGYSGVLSIRVPETTLGWNIKVTFDKNVESMQIRNEENKQWPKLTRGKSNEKCNDEVCTFNSMEWNKDQTKDTILNVRYKIYHKSLEAPKIIGLLFNGVDICSKQDSNYMNHLHTTLGQIDFKDYIIVFMIVLIFIIVTIFIVTFYKRKLSIICQRNTTITGRPIF